jgi:predicted nuclease of predicted toxin-antitoxin system
VKILFDQGVPVPLRKHLANHQVATAYERGWGAIKNGDLIAMAEREGFDLLLTTDQNLKYQQDLTHRKIAIAVLLSRGPTKGSCVNSRQDHLYVALAHAAPQARA